MPAVVICTRPFRVPALATARAYAVPDFPHLLTPHPVANLTADEVAARADELLPRVLETLGVRRDR